ncbi:MAG: YciI family protein [Pseudomonadota bacterium]
MLFAVLFEDNPNAPGDVRQRHMADHLAFLERHAGQIQVAGPLFEHGEAAGGLWLVNAATVGEVDAMVHADPFWPTGLRESYRVLEWRQVFARDTPGS